MKSSDIIQVALAEDLGSGDITTDATVPESLKGRGVLLAKQNLVVAGLQVVRDVFLTLDPTIQIKELAQDGDEVKNPTPLLEIEGSYRILLKGERLALNFLARLCGVATLTKTYVAETSGTQTKILDTRKTTPLLRQFEKYAVRMGGGVNHRIGLYDAILIKDNHIAACNGDVAEAISRSRLDQPKHPITVEIAKVSDVKIAIAAGAERLLLDNMDNDTVREAVSAADGKAEIEVSGGITKERIRQLSDIGVDFISVGALTHSAPSMDVSLEIVPT